MMFMAIACFVIPAIGRYIDHAAPADTIGCELQYERGFNKLSFDFTATATNEKDHLAAETEDGRINK